MLDQDKADHPRLDITLADIENDAAIGDNSDQEDDYDHKALKGWVNCYDKFCDQEIIKPKQRICP